MPRLCLRLFLFLSLYIVNKNCKKSEKYDQVSIPLIKVNYPVNFSFLTPVILVSMANFYLDANGAITACHVTERINE